MRLPFKKPRSDYLERLKSVAGPVMMVALIKCIFVGAIVRSATAISPEASAANGVLFTVYFFFAVVGEGVSQAAQAFLPPQLGNFEKASKLAFNIMLVGVRHRRLQRRHERFSAEPVPANVHEERAGDRSHESSHPIHGLGAFRAHRQHGIRRLSPRRARRRLHVSLLRPQRPRLRCVTLSILSANGFGVRASWIALFQFHCVRLVINAVRLRAANSPLRKSLSAVADDFENRPRRRRRQFRRSRGHRRRRPNPNPDHVVIIVKRWSTCIVDL